jgi:hypothetical protein
VRSVERTVEEILLPSISALHDSPDELSPEYGFGWRWATGWLAAQMRTAPPAHRPESILLIDASRPLALDGLHAQALELVVRRAGAKVLSLPVDLDPLRIGRALAALTPRAVVLVGRGASLDLLGRLVYAARRTSEDVTVYDYRGALPETGASTVQDVTVYDYRGALPETGASTVPRLGERPLAARAKLLADLEERARNPRVATG